ncbi:MAG TPA: DUF4065 domain-containing protein [bacterium]|nr:DUF4065 domain-containing protein [bacterium]
MSGNTIEVPTSSNVTYEDVANFFIALANETGDIITNLKLQKLVYYAQAWYLANYKKPLFDEDFEAWIHGPVIPDLYHKYKSFGYSPIETKIDFSSVENLDSTVKEFLAEVAKIYMTHGAYELEAMTHQEQPWIDARDGCEPDENCSNVIPKKSMMEFYGAKISS